MTSLLVSPNGALMTRDGGIADSRCAPVCCEPTNEPNGCCFERTNPVDDPTVSPCMPPGYVLRTGGGGVLTVNLSVDYEMQLYDGSGVLVRERAVSGWFRGITDLDTDAEDGCRQSYRVVRYEGRRDQFDRARVDGGYLANTLVFVPEVPANPWPSTFQSLQDMWIPTGFGNDWFVFEDLTDAARFFRTAMDVPPDEYDPLLYPGSGQAPGAQTPGDVQASQGVGYGAGDNFLHLNSCTENRDKTQVSPDRVRRRVEELLRIVVPSLSRTSYLVEHWTDWLDTGAPNLHIRTYWHAESLWDERIPCPTDLLQPSGRGGCGC